MIDGRRGGGGGPVDGAAAHLSLELSLPRLLGIPPREVFAVECRPVV